VPPLALLAAALLARIPEARLPRARALHAGVVVLLLLPPVLSTAETNARLGRKDTRTEAREWFEKNVPPGALVLLEPHGPNLRSLSDLRRYEEAEEFAAIRGALLRRAEEERWYATATLPSFSIDVDRAARFYRFAPYQWFDYIVVTSEIRDRYTRDPDRFPVQAAFYEELRRRYRHAAVIGSARSRPGPTIDVYRRDDAPLPLADVRLDKEGAHDADFLAFFRSIAGLYRDRGLLPEAAKLDLALLDLNPNDSETLLHLGLLAAAGGDVRGGILLLDRAARIEPGNRQIRMNLGVLLCQEGRLEEGTEIFRALLAAGEDAEIHGNLASALLEAGREEEAAAHLRRFLELAPDHVQAGEVRALLQSLEAGP
jgi:tetratricopeptide (TPR) repeat protein